MENLMIASISKPPPATPILPRKQDSSTTTSSSSSPSSSSLKPTRTNLDSLCKTRDLNQALQLLDSVSLNDGAHNKVSPKTYINLLNSVIELGDAQLGRRLHDKLHLVENVNPFVETKILSMYAKCGCFDDAIKFFHRMRERNLYTWSAMIGACTREHRWREAVELFYCMVKDGAFPDAFLFPKILQASAHCRDVETGKVVHSLVVKFGMVEQTRVGNAILDMYVKCGKLCAARRFFDSMIERDTVAWNTMIMGYCQNGESEEGFRLFDRMRREGVKPALVTWNILINSHNQLGHCEVALDLMRQMESLGVEPDVFTWTSLISGFAQNGRTNQALNLFEEMLVVGINPTAVTMTSAVSACASLKSLDAGLEIHSIIVKMGFLYEVLVGNALIDMYSKCGDLEAAWLVFDSVVQKDVYTWNSVIGGYCQAGYHGKAHELFMKMKESGVSPTVITWNVMISGFIQNGDEDQALDLFQRMEIDGKVKRNTASWNSLIAGYVHIGRKDKALWIFRQMQSLGVSPNTVTILSVLPACANLVSVKMLKEVHGCVLRRNLDCIISVTNALLDSYAKSGNIEYSRAIFDAMLSTDVITWNSMISGYVLHGCPTVALDLFNRMLSVGLRPNRGTFLCIIHAYALAGMVDEGMQFFSSIIEDWQVVPALEHYSAMIHLYGRSRRLQEAKEFIEDMPMDPDSTIWDAFLTACRNHGNVRLAVYAAEQLLNLEPGNLIVHQLVLQLYALCGINEEASKEIIERRYPSQSWIEINNTVHTFVTGDQKQPYADHLHSWLQSLEGNDKKREDHHTFCIEEEEKEEIIGVHSEKLALAFAFIGSSVPPRCVRIVKNMRMCRDCHRTAKYVSLTAGCEIYLNDSKFLHHFKNGQCSCGDYW